MGYAPKMSSLNAINNLGENFHSSFINAIAS